MIRLSISIKSQLRLAGYANSLARPITGRNFIPDQAATAFLVTISRQLVPAGAGAVPSMRKAITKIK